jgi:hypothetical protein
MPYSLMWALSLSQYVLSPGVPGSHVFAQAITAKAISF